MTWACRNVCFLAIDNWAVLSDEQMSNGWSHSLLNDEQMSNKVRVEHQPEKDIKDILVGSMQVG